LKKRRKWKHERSAGHHDGLDRDHDRRGRAKPDAGYPLDGEDLKPVVSGKRGLYDRIFFWRTYAQGGARSGKWKYIREGKNEFLFDFSVDEREQGNYKDLEPQVLERLRGEFNRWESSVLAYPKS
jgi:hypothetical protein